jgi:branched-chain amino acid transport system substrate-binding protein
MSTSEHSTWTWRAACAAAVAIFGLSCASARGPTTAPGTEPVPDTPERRAAEREAAQLYDTAADSFDVGSFAVADSLATRLVTDYEETTWVGPGLLLAARASLERNQPEVARDRAARYLRLYRASDPRRVPGLVLVARTLHIENRPIEAADSLLSTPHPLGDEREEAAQAARQVVSELGLTEIDSLTQRWPADHPLRSVFEVEKASLLMAAGEEARAREAAEQVMTLDPLEPERERAEAILSGELTSEQWRPIIGAILPLSGPLKAYGQMAEEGIRLAIDEYNQRHADQVTLIVRDDGDRYERARDLVRELERLGAMAIIGPLRAEGLEAAADGRRERDLLIISPTAPENLSFQRNTFSLWNTTERVTRDARALAAFAVKDLHLTRFGVMYPSTQEGRMQLAAFADAVRAWGGEVAASITYEDTATTFQEPMTYLRSASPQAIFAPASDATTIIQMSPQFSYYNLRGVQVLGDAEWSDPRVLRLVEPRFIDGTVIATFMDRSSPSVRWPQFVAMYERAYRKGLEENLVPALAYDATRMILASLPWGYPRRAAIARSFNRIRSLPGATGVLSVEHGAITRRPFLLQFKERNLLPAFQGDDRLTGEGDPRR